MLNSARNKLNAIYKSSKTIMTLNKINIRFPLIATVITVVVILILVKLGFWQLDRAEEKRALFADYHQHQQQNDAVSLTTLKAVSPETDRFRYVSVHGHFQTQPLFFLDNRVENSQVGYHIIGLFTPDVNPETAVPVNLGWVAASVSRQALPDITLPDGQHEITGFLYFPSDNRFTENTYETQFDNGRIRVQAFQPATVAQQRGIALTPYLLLLETPSDMGWQRNWEPQVMTPEKHQGYALQWFSLAVACLVIFVFAVIKLNKQSKEEETR